MVLDDPAAGGELSDQRPIEFAAGRVVEILETRVRNPELRFFEPAGELAIVPREVLGLDEQADALVETERPDRRVLELRAVGVGHRAEMEGAQAVEGRFGQHGRSPSGLVGSTRGHGRWHAAVARSPSRAPRPRADGPGRV